MKNKLTSKAKDIFDLCAELTHEAYMASDGDYGALPTWGARTPQVERMIQAAGPEGDLVSWDTAGAIHRVLQRYTNGGENFFVVRDLASPYDGLQIDQAAQYAAHSSELPRLGDEIGYSDFLLSEAAYHDLVRRMAEQKLCLDDTGWGYTVARIVEE